MASFGLHYSKNEFGAGLCPDLLEELTALSRAIADLEMGWG